MLLVTSKVTPVIGLVLAVPDIVLDRSRYRRGGVLCPGRGGPGVVAPVGLVIVMCNTDSAVRYCDSGSGVKTASDTMYETFNMCVVKIACGVAGIVRCVCSSIKIASVDIY